MITVLGSTNVDVIVSGLAHMPRVEGDEFTAASLTLCDEPLAVRLGGNGGNAAFVLARLGAAPILASAIGRDALGHLVRGWLDDAGVDTSTLVQHADRATASTTMLVDRVQNRLAFHHPGALHTYGPDELEPTVLARSEALLVTSYTLLPRWRPKGFRETLAAAHRQGSLTALDIGPAIGTPAALDELADTLPHVDYLIANEHEWCVCTGTTDLDAALRQIRTAEVRCLIVKRGKAGALIVRGGQDAPQTVPGFAVTVRSTVGAGDAFNAGLLAALRDGRALPEAVRFANAMAACVVASERGVLDAPDRVQAEQMLTRTAPEA